MEDGRTIYTICSGLGVRPIPSVVSFRQKLFFAWSLRPRNLTPNPFPNGKGNQSIGGFPSGEDKMERCAAHGLQVAQKVRMESGGIVHPLTPSSKLKQCTGCGLVVSLDLGA